MIPLFSIKEEYKTLLSDADHALMTEGVIPDDLEQRITINKEQLIEKVENYKYVLAMVKSHQEMAAAELLRVEAFKEKAENLEKTFKKALLEALLLYGEEDKNGVKRLECGTIRLSTRKSTPVAIEDEEDIPSEYKKTKYTVSDADTYKINQFMDHEDISFELSDPVISKTLIKKALEGDIDVPSASMEPSYSLTIK